MDILYLFVDGSFIKRRGEMHAGVVAIKNAQIIAENYVKTKDLHNVDYHHEELAMIVGLNLAKQIDDIKEINLYSDSMFLVDLLNKKGSIKKDKLYKKKKPFIKKIINLKKYFLDLYINLNIRWVQEEQNLGLKRVHKISRKWSTSEDPLIPFFIDENKNLELLFKANKKKRRTQFGFIVPNFNKPIFSNW